MATAAENQLRLIDWQIWLTAAEIFLLIGTVVLSALSTRAAFAGTRAANAAIEQSERHAQQQLRAYLAMVPEAAGGFFAGDVVTIELRPRNHGQTPAYKIRHMFEIEVLPYPLPKVFVFPKPTRVVATNFTAFPQGQDKTWFNAKAATQAADITSVANGAATLNIWGTTFYNDAFGNTHSVDFNAYVGGIEFVEAQAAFRNGMPYHGKMWSWSWGAGHNNGD
jgi:hypothetical protein